MKKKRNYIGIMMFLMIFILILILGLIFWNTWNDYYRKMIIDPFYEKGSLLLTVSYLIIYFLFSNIYEGFKIGYLKTSEIIYSQTLSLIFANIIIYMQISLISKKLVNPIYLLFMTVIETIVIIVWSLVCNKLYFSIYPPINMLMIYRNQSAANLMSKMRLHKDKYRICETINIREGYDLVIEAVDKYEAVIICDLDSTMRNKILKYCYDKSIRTYITPKISDLIIQSSEKLHIFDTPLMICKNQGLSFEEKVFKRIFDLVLSVLAIIITSPIMIIVSVLIKIYDRGPIIFTQERLTLNNRVFEIYKFRSMIVDAEKNGEVRLASKNDSRITPIGKVIRKLRIDELPQLFNILKGDMSIVGPRPERPEIVEQYIKVMPEFNLRTKVKAGLTGYAQIMGKYNTNPYDKLKLDLMYIGNYSFFMDIKMILMTIKILFMPESTEGLDEGKILPELAINKDGE